MILHSIDKSTEVWALSGSLYWHVADTASLAAYQKATPPIAQVTITAGEHAAILAARAPVPVVVNVDATAVAKALAPLLPTAPTADQVASAVATHMGADLAKG
jgi:hypothetical protein